MKNNRALILLACLISLGGFLFGFDAAIISSVGGLAVREFGLSDLEFGVLVGAPSLAAIIAGLVVGPMSDLIGRRITLIIVAVLYAISAALSAWAPDFQWLVWGRALGGFAFASLVLAPLYIAEIAPSDSRGRLVSINQLNIVIGFAVAYFTGYYLLLASQSGTEFVQSIGLADHNWRWMLGAELIPAGLFLLALLWAPESPRWLMVHNKEEAARKVVRRYHPPELVEAELDEIRTSIENSRSRDKTPLHILFHPGVVKLLGIGLIVAVAQQITGINAVFFYAQTIFELTGAGTNAAFAQATVIGLVNVAFTLLAMALIDRVGRRPLLIAGLIGVVVSMTVAGFGFQQARFELTTETIASIEADWDTSGLDAMADVTYRSDVDFRQALDDNIGEDLAREHRPELTNLAIDINAVLVLAGIIGFVASFAFSLGPVMWVLLSEIFPNRIRGLAMSAVTFVNAGVSAAVQVFFPIQLAELGAGLTFYTYAAFGLFFVVLVARFVPETKGLTLEALEESASR
jgi:sugar porter (SP) family MFS transporter